MQAELDVQGMSCQKCVASVTRALQAVQGVTRVEVSLEHASATVEFDESLAVRDELVGAVEAAGFDCR